MLSPRASLIALGALALGVTAAMAAVLVVGGEEQGAPSTTRPVVAEPVSGPPVRLAGTDVVSGEEIGLKALAGKPVVLVVWASWCGACAAQVDALRRFVAKEKDAALLAVDTQEDASAARAFLAESGLTIPTIADPDGRLAAQLGTRELPSTLFLTADHRVSSAWEGPAIVSKLRAALHAAQAS